MARKKKPSKKFLKGDEPAVLTDGDMGRALGFSPAQEQKSMARAPSDRDLNRKARRDAKQAAKDEADE